MTANTPLPQRKCRAWTPRKPNVRQPAPCRLGPNTQTTGMAINSPMVMIAATSKAKDCGARITHMAELAMTTAKAATNPIHTSRPLQGGERKVSRIEEEFIGTHYTTQHASAIALLSAWGSTDASTEKNNAQPLVRGYRYTFKAKAVPFPHLPRGSGSYIRYERCRSQRP